MYGHEVGDPYSKFGPALELSRKDLVQIARGFDINAQNMIFQLPLGGPKRNRSGYKLPKTVGPLVFHLSVSSLTTLTLSDYRPTKEDNRLIKRSPDIRLKNLSLGWTVAPSTRNAFKNNPHMVELIALLICPSVRCKLYKSYSYVGLEYHDVSPTDFEKFAKYLLLNKKLSYFFVPEFFAIGLYSSFRLAGSYYRYRHMLSDSERIELQPKIGIFLRKYGGELAVLKRNVKDL